MIADNKDEDKKRERENTEGQKNLELKSTQDRDAGKTVGIYGLNQD